jgi:hypothetical protein
MNLSKFESRRASICTIEDGTLKNPVAMIEEKQGLYLKRQRQDGPPEIPGRRGSFESLKDDDSALSKHCNYNFASLLPEDCFEDVSDITDSTSTLSLSSSLNEEASFISSVPPCSSPTVKRSRFHMECSPLRKIPRHIRGQLSHEDWIQILSLDASDHDDENFPLNVSDMHDNITLVLSSDHLDRNSSSRLIGIAAADVERRKEKRRKSARRKKVQSVSFGRVHVRFYERILEVHPCTSAGPSLGLGWNFVEEERSEKIDWYKINKPCQEFRLSRSKREQILGELGYNPRDLARAIRRCLKIKKQRRKTINNLRESHTIVPVEKVEYLIERCHRNLRKVLPQL